ncbi:ArsR/SmtB family transcription factor [Streptacidiphilus sp. EB129]|uniref:ArsR/SmtB family transcription factor n=1 Tax=Streptacidiphilus sp. EB129 TaxID=3156262 RepID=UPI003514C2CB
MSLVQTAGLLADRTRAEFCLALLDGRAWTAGELARHAGVSAATASEQLTRLIDGGLLAEERQGRHRYVRLAGPAVASLIEELSSFGPAGTRPRSAGLRESSRLSAEARGRTCYDHLAGQLGVGVSDALLRRGLVSDEDGLSLTASGRSWFAAQDIAIEPAPAPRRSTRPVLRGCLDWTERRMHLGGLVGAALCRTAFERGWVERIGTGRALRLTTLGVRDFTEPLGLARPAA